MAERRRVAFDQTLELHGVLNGVDIRLTVIVECMEQQALLEWRQRQDLLQARINCLQLFHLGLR